MSRTQPRSRGSAAVAKRMWKESPIKSMVALFSAVALTVGMTPLFGALGQVNQAYADTAPDVVIAPLVDRSGTGWNNGTDITNDCGVSVSATEDGNTNVTVTYSATALQKHHNSEGTYAYWAGVAVPQESGCTYSTSWDGSNYTEDSSPISYTKDEKNYYSFYFGTYRPTLASKTGYIQVKNSGNVVKTYTINFSNVTCVGDAVVAPLNDHGAPGAPDTNADKRPVNYACEQTAQDGVVTITLKGTGLDKHFNAQHKEAYWAGVGIPYTNSTDKLELGYGTYSTEAQANAGTGTGSVDYEAGGTNYTSIYFDNAKVKSEGGIWVRVKNGETTVAAYQIQSEITNNYAIAKDTAVEHGIITVDESATEGDEVTVTAMPDEGYELDTITATKGSGETAEQIEVTDGKFMMPASDVTVSATFKAVYTVTFDSNGGSAVDSVKVDSGKSVAKPADPTREGYIFGEWQLYGKPYEFTAGVMSNITLKATWTEIPAPATYTVTFDSNGGSKVEAAKVESGRTATKPTDPTREGYTFGEWQLDGKAYDFSTPVTGNVTLKATWTEDVDPEPAVEGQTMHRLYNPNSGEHFYTSSELEYTNLVSLGWHDEGVGWQAPEKSNTPVYRLYNANGGEHHFTMSKVERDNLISLGWNDEGIGWYSDDAEGQVLYREYNPNTFANNHNYTASKAEHDYLVSIGWNDEGTAWYGLAAS